MGGGKHNASESVLCIVIEVVIRWVTRRIKEEKKEKHSLTLLPHKINLKSPRLLPHPRLAVLVTKDIKLNIMQPDDMTTSRLKPALSTPSTRLTLAAVVIGATRQESVAREGGRVGDKDGPDGTLDEFAVPDGGVQADATREAVLEDDEGVVIPIVYDSAG